MRNYRIDYREIYADGHTWSDSWLVSALTVRSALNQVEAGDGLDGHGRRTQVKVTVTEISS